MLTWGAMAMKSSRQLNRSAERGETLCGRHCRPTTARKASSMTARWSAARTFRHELICRGFWARSERWLRPCLRPVGFGIQGREGMLAIALVAAEAFRQAAKLEQSG